MRTRSDCQVSGHVRTVPMPAWVKLAIDAWVASAGIEVGLVFRCVSKTGYVWGDGISEKVVWWVVREYAKLAGIRSWLRTTCGELVRGFAIQQAASSNRFNSCSVTAP